MPSKFPFKVGERVIYDEVCRNYPPHTGKGEIVGICTEFPIVTFYIVLLDDPVLLTGKETSWRGFVVPSSCLTRIVPWIAVENTALDNTE